MDALLAANPGLITHDEEGKPREGVRGRLVPVTWKEHKESLNAREFFMAYRMSATVFTELLAVLLPFLPEQDVQRTLASTARDPIEHEIMLAMTL